MFSEKAVKNIDACRFCWMCRHICPVGLVTGRESNNAKSKALLLSLHLRGQAFTPEMAEDMFQCCLCNACADSCETGFEPAVFIREARRMAAVEEIIPGHVAPVIDRLLAGAPLREAAQSSKLPGVSGAKDGVLIILGSYAYGNQKAAEALAALIERTGIPVGTLDSEPPCGWELYDLIGNTEETLAISAAFAEKVRAAAPKEIVVMDPSCACMLKQIFPAWALELSGRVTTATSFLAELVKTGKLPVIRRASGTVVFHDPCRLARDLDETEPARELIDAMGLKRREMFRHGRNTNCCGGELIAAHSPELAVSISARRQEEAQRTGAEMILTACACCQENLARAGGLPVKDLIEQLAECCL